MGERMTKDLALPRPEKSGTLSLRGGIASAATSALRRVRSALQLLGRGIRFFRRTDLLAGATPRMSPLKRVFTGNIAAFLRHPPARRCDLSISVCY